MVTSGMRQVLAMRETLRPISSPFPLRFYEPNLEDPCSHLSGWSPTQKWRIVMAFDRPSGVCPRPGRLSYLQGRTFMSFAVSDGRDMRLHRSPGLEL